MLFSFLYSICWQIGKWWWRCWWWHGGYDEQNNISFGKQEKKYYANMRFPLKHLTQVFKRVH